MRQQHHGQRPDASAPPVAKCDSIMRTAQPTTEPARSPVNISTATMTTASCSNWLRPSPQCLACHDGHDTPLRPFVSVRSVPRHQPADDRHQRRDERDVTSTAIRRVWGSR